LSISANRSFSGGIAQALAREKIEAGELVSIFVSFCSGKRNTEDKR